jgi:hypothetical protein
MQKDERDLLEVLKFELNFLEKGGYGRSPRAPWRPQFIFEDSPTCMNYDSKETPGPCGDCVLMQLVPPELRSQRIPCRHISLNASGETLDSLYRSADQYEVEDTVGGWLRATIQRLEEERAAVQPDHNKQPSPCGEAIKGTALHQSLHPKCANPACPIAFHWLQGGKFFRFRNDRTSAVSSCSTCSTVNPPADVHGVKHFWLCERCSHVFTLVYEESQGVMLKLRWLELPVVEARKELTAA